MKKIMFNDRFGLTKAVLDGTKTMTRRIIPLTESDKKYLATAFDWDIRERVIIDRYAKFKIGDEVAVAQSYKSVFEESLSYALPRYHWLDDHIDEIGFTNKMYVKASEMPHQIQITKVKIERLQAISEEDCLKEGVAYDSRYWVNGYIVENLWNKVDRQSHFRSAQVAFASLIDKVCGKGTWELNPFVFAYSFKLIK